MADTSSRLNLRRGRRVTPARQYPLPGIGSPDELAELMVWLLSDKAARVTGQVWSMDAGFSTIRPLVR